MYKKEFLPYLSTQQSTHFVLFGACNVSVDFYSNLLKNHYNMQEILNIDFEDYDFERCKEFLNLSSLFAESKLLFIKANKLPPAKDLKALLELCDDEKKMIISLYDCANLPDIAKYTKNFVRFFLPQNNHEAVDFLMQIAKQNSVLLDKEKISSIYDSLNNDLFLSYCEMNKYKDFSPSIKFIQAQCGSEFDIDFELFFDEFISGKNIEKNLSSYLFFSQTNEIYALNTIVNQFLKIFKIKLALKNNIQIQDCLGYNPPKDVLFKLQKWSNSIEFDRFDDLFRLFTLCERELKIEQKELKKELLFSYILKAMFILQKD